MKQSTALIVCDNKTYTKRELFRFYHTNIKKDSDIYAKMIEFIPLENCGFYLFYAPFSEKMNEKKYKYLTQVIEQYRTLTGGGPVFFRCFENGDKKQEKLSYHAQNRISCISYFSPIDIIEKLAKKKHIKLTEARIICFCDEPAKAEKIIKEICKKVRQITICTKNQEKFKGMVQYFFENYGILLSLTDTIGNEKDENTIFLLLSEDQEQIKQAVECGIDPINLLNQKTGEKDIIERFYFYCNQKLERVVKKLGLIFDSESLLFLYEVLNGGNHKKDFSDFTNKYDIKILKFVKND